MNYADLGPAPPKEAIDLPPFAIRSWSIVGELNGLNEAVLTFSGFARTYNHDVVLLVSVSPRSLLVTRCTCIYPSSMRHEVVPVEWVPGIVSDLAASKTLEVFGP